MKIKVEPVIVVEGKSDVDFLSSFLEADFVTTNGSEISEETLRYLKEIAKKRGIILLTDPDYPGLQIRSRIAEQIPSVQHAYVRKEKSIKHHKVGVAESTKEEVLLALEQVEKKQYKTIESDITQQDLFDLGLIGKKESLTLRIELGKDFHLGYIGNAKRALKELQALGVQKKELEEWKKKHDSK